LFAANHLLILLGDSAIRPSLPGIGLLISPPGHPLRCPLAVFLEGSVPMRNWLSTLLFYGWVVAGCFLLPTSAESAETVLHSWLPRKRVAADPAADYTLGENQGPWLVLATSFSGPEGEQKARDLVLDLRKDFKLHAYYWGMTFQTGDANVGRGPGRGIDAYGAPIRHRYRRGNQVVEHAVLVGNFSSIDAPQARQALKRIKTLQPESLSMENQQATAENMTDIRTYRKYMLKHLGKGNDKGPMGQAFMTRNPLLPQEYFVAASVDEAVAKWNEGLEFSLLHCPGEFSIKVATFRGRSSIKGSLAGTSDRTRKAKKSDPLVQAGINAHLLAVALREKGWEAYEFHDRTESYVAIGSFEQISRRLPDGRIVPTHNAQIIINTFGASTPNNIFNRAAAQDAMLENQKKQEFNTRFASGGVGQVVSGFHPKRFVGMPFDIHPEAVKVPRRAISTAYMQ